MTRIVALPLFVATLIPATVSAQVVPSSSPQATALRTSSDANRAAAPMAAVVPPDYVIGPDDVLSIVFWREKDMSTDVVVRPDGKISLPLLNDVQASGLTPEQVRQDIESGARRFFEDPNATVVVKEIKSRRVYITGQVEKPGPYTITGPTTVLQLLAMAGGLKEYAGGKKIVIMRTENGRPTGYRFNYEQVVDRKNLKQNIDLKPGDTVVVP